MKNVFIVLLLAAIGAGVYFYFSKRQKPSSNPQELILGIWKVDSVVDKRDESSMVRDGLLSALDSTLKNYEIEFQKDILISQTHDGEMKDTSLYEFHDGRNLSTWGRNDTAKTKWSIQRIDSTRLIVRDQDSALFYLQRMK